MSPLPERKRMTLRSTSCERVKASTCWFVFLQKAIGKTMFRLGWHVVQVLGAELCSVTGVSLVSICRHMPIMIPLPPPTQDYHCSNHQRPVTCSSKPHTSPRQGKDQDAATPPDPKVLASKLENVKDRTSTASFYLTQMSENKFQPLRAIMHHTTHSFLYVFLVIPIPIAGNDNGISRGVRCIICSRLDLYYRYFGQKRNNPVETRATETTTAGRSPP